MHELQNISILIYKQTCPPMSIIWNTSQVRPSGNNHSETFMLKILQRQELLSYSSLPTSHEGSTMDLLLDFKISDIPWSDKVLRMVSSGTETKSDETVVVKTSEIFLRSPWLCCFHRAAGLFLFCRFRISVFSLIIRQEQKKKLPGVLRVKVWDAASHHHR